MTKGLFSLDDNRSVAPIQCFNVDGRYTVIGKLDQTKKNCDYGSCNRRATHTAIQYDHEGLIVKYCAEICEEHAKEIIQHHETLMLSKGE